MADKRSLEFHISADLPIQNKEEDKLNRNSFAEALGRVIRSWQGKPSLVIGLFGDWGSGKSSLKNLAVRSIQRGGDQSPQVVEFSPWQVSSQELLAETFFLEIGKALAKTGPLEEAVVKRRVARWKMYSSILSMTGTVARAFQSALSTTDHTSFGYAAVATVATAIKEAGAVVKTGAEAVEAEGAAGILTLSELKEQISDDLRLLDNPILVILDDIDRLTKKEVRYILQLIKANADFPNIIYLLLAQKQSLLKALKKVAPGDALAYLEKIVQVSFDVPSVNRKQLQDVLVKGLDELLGSPELKKRFSKEYWGAINPHLFNLFRNFRDINRFLGALAFHIQLFLNGNTFEVNPVDLIALEAIRLFEPEVYKRIPEVKDVLISMLQRGYEKSGEQNEQRIENLINLSSRPNRDTIQKLLAEVFPASNTRKNRAFQSDGIENHWFQQLRVCSYQVFDRYFQFATPEGDVSQADIESLIRSMGDIRALDGIFARLASRDLLYTMLTRIASLQNTLPLDNASSFLAALYQIPIPKRPFSIFESSPTSRAYDITYYYLQRLPEAERFSVMEETLRLTQGLALVISTVQLLTLGPDARSRAPFFDEQVNRDRLKEAGIAVINRAIAPNSQIPPESILLVLNFWVMLDSSAAAYWLDTYLSNRSAITSYLELIVSVAEGTGGTRQFIQVANFERLISIEELEKRLELFLVGELTSDEAKLDHLVKRGIQRRREGREHPLAMWDQEDEGV